MTLEDETGSSNAIVWPKVFEAHRPMVIGARFVAVTGRVQNEPGVIHVIAERMEDLTPLLGMLSLHGGEAPPPLPVRTRSSARTSATRSTDATPLLRPVSPAASGEDASYP